MQKFKTLVLSSISLLALSAQAHAYSFLEACKYNAVSTDDIWTVQMVKGALGTETCEDAHSKLGVITSLDLSNKHIISIKLLDSLSAYPQLRSLNLNSNSGIKDIKSISQLKQLDKLQLVGIGDIKDSSIFSELVNLKHLDLNYTKLTEADALSTLKKLEYLDISDSPVKSYEFLKPLKSVRYLSIDGSSFGDASIFSPLGELKNLREFHISTSGTNFEAKPVEFDFKLLSSANDIEVINIHSSDFKTVSDLSGLAGLNNLKTLKLYVRGLHSLKGIEHATKLNTLLIRSHLTSLNGIENLRNLKSVDVSYNNLIDISALSNIKGIEFLSLAGNRELQDIYALQGMRSLKELSLEFTKVDDLTSLASARGLKILDITGLPVTTLAGLERMEDLTKLDASMLSQLKSLNGLEGLFSLEYANFTELSPKVESLVPLINSVKLKTLIITADMEAQEQGRISDFSPIAYLKNLKDLTFSGQSIQDITAIDKLDELVNLNVSNNHISKIGTFSKTNKLMKLNVSHNKISDLSPFVASQTVSELEVENNPFKSIKPLKNHASLKTLDLGNNFPGSFMGQVKVRMNNLSLSLRQKKQKKELIELSQTGLKIIYNIQATQLMPGWVSWRYGWEKVLQIGE